ncbi:MAG: FliM/FliN family flagellar motor switch protein [Sedimentisphaerales bacterium]|nr:FliM/FliN family flagellar motor switch protein [Sedimentisphaerales bacterium]
MTSTQINPLDKKGIQRLLASIGSKPVKVLEQPEAMEYDWTSPHYFSSSQSARLKDFTTKVAKKVAAKFSALCQNEFQVTVLSITEHYVYDILNGKTEQNDYHLVFAADEEHFCGFIGIPLESAMAWAAQLLGDSENSVNPDRKLSELEESLLSDAALAFLEAFSESFENRDFQPVTGITNDKPDLKLQDADELCKIEIEIKNAASQKGSNANLIILCRELLYAIENSTETQDEDNAEDISNNILNHLLDVPVVVTALLASTTIKLGQAMNLEPGDILMLNKETDSPIELVVNNQSIVRAWPAKSGRQYAVIVTD